MYTYYDLEKRFRQAPKALRGLQNNYSLPKDIVFSNTLSEVLLKGFCWDTTEGVGCQLSYWNFWHQKLVQEEPITKHRFERWNDKFIGMGEIGDFWELCEEHGATREMTMYEAYLCLPIADQHYNVDEAWKEYAEN